jgi:hypothetical protein
VPASAAPSAPPSSAAGSAVATAEPSGSATTATIGIPALGLSIRLPTGWVGLDATVPTSIIESTESRYPDLAESLAKLRTSELGFVGYDAAAGSPPTPNLTIATTGDEIAVPSLLEALARQTAEQLARTESISDVEHSAATLAAGPAAELRYRWTPKGAGGPVAVDAWFISTAGHTFVLTFSVPAASAEALRPEIRAAANSLSGS